MREFKDQISSPKLQQEVKDFTRQEAQHSLVHRQYNERLKKQGGEIDVLTVSFGFPLGYYLAYYKPGFHPWKVKEMPSHGTWLQTFQRTGDPIAAGNALLAAGQ